MNLFQILRHYPLVVVTISYIFGIVVSPHFSLKTSYFLIAFCLTIFALFFSGKKYAEVTLSLLSLFFFLIGIYAGNNSQRLPSSPYHVYNQIINKQEGVIIGKIKHISGFNGEITKLDVNAESLRTYNQQLHPVFGTIRYTIKGEIPASVVPGEMVAIRAKLKRPQRYLTPGSFNYPAYLAQQGIYMTGFIQSQLHLQLIQTENSIINRLRYYPEVLRVKINRFIDASLTGDKAAIYKALLTGDRSSISPSTLENYRNSGCIHILACM